MSHHPIVLAAAEGNLPEWAKVTSKRKEHIQRVAALLEQWAVEAEVDEDERIRWVAAGWLHDSLKDKKTKKLRKMVSKETRKSLPAPVLHGPAAAARLRDEGVEDEELLVAVQHHTLGHPDFGSTGLALYAADFLEPGRTARKKWRGRLRNDMPDSVHDVVARIVRDRMTFLLQRGRTLHPQTVAFWNRLMRQPR